MHRRFHQVIAFWFALQIVLPFTAPLQTCDLNDLLGTRSHHATSPEQSSTPTACDVDSKAHAVAVSSVTIAPGAPAPLAGPARPPSLDRFEARFALFLDSPPPQPLVLRL